MFFVLSPLRDDQLLHWTVTNIVTGAGLQRPVSRTRREEQRKRQQ